jgi:hypothetical protein
MKKAPKKDIGKQEYKGLEENKQKLKEVPKQFADFSEEFIGKIAKIQVLNQSLLIGTIKEVRAYWIKVLTHDNRILYINKAYIIQIEPVSKT